MNALTRRNFLIGSAVVGTAAAGTWWLNRDEDSALQKIDLTIDWVPSAEYFPYFLAKQQGLYADAGFDVTIKNGTGAPAVATQLASGATPIGTTTSDNLVRILAKGAKIAAATPILKFNPSTLITKVEIGTDLTKLAGKVVGVNVQSATYSQFQAALKLAGVDPKSFKEFPIGYGGPEEFESGRVDAFLGYTTNHPVDLTLKGVRHFESRFDDLGIKSAGQVLVVTAEGDALSAGSKSLIAASIAGLAVGLQKPSEAIEALRAKDPTLDAQKLSGAITKIASLNQLATQSVYDEWLRDGTPQTDRAITSMNAIL